MQAGDVLGTHRVVAPKGALPQPAERLDADLSKQFATEIEIEVETLNIDAASFRQMEEASGGSTDGVGALVMEDEAGQDEKILAVPVDALHPFYMGVQSYRDLPVIMCEQIAHFFQHYKDLEKGKWVTIVKWLDTDGAEQLVVEAIERAKGQG